MLGLGVGIGIGRGTRGSDEAGKTAGPPAAASKSDRTRKAGGREAPGDAGIEDLLTMVRSGRSELAMAKVTMALQDLPPARLAQLAEEMRDFQRKNPNYDWNQMQLLQAVMSAWTDSDPKAALAFARQSPSRSFRAQALGVVFNVLGEANAEDALARAREIEDPAERRNALGSVSWALAQRDPQQALELFGDMKELPENAKVAIISELAKQDPLRAAEEMAKVSPLERERFWNSEGIFNTWAGKDPEAVFAWAEKATDLDLRNSALKAACRRLAGEDPAGALSRVDGLPPHLRKDLVSTIIGTWADRDLKGALAAAGALDQPAEREMAMSAIVNQLDWLNPNLGSEVVLAMPKGNSRTGALQQLAWGTSWQSSSEKMALLEKFEGVERSKMASLMASSMISEDADAAMRLFSSVPPTQRDEYSFRRFTWALAEHDPEQALNFSRELESASERGQLVKQAFDQLAKLSPTDAAARLVGLTDSNDRQQALTALAESWGATDAAAALSWASTLRGEERATALASLLPQQAINDPQSAGSQLRELIESPAGAPTAVLQSAATQLATEWAGRNPEAAGAWIQELPAGNAAEAGAGALVRNWSTHDPAAAAQWLSSLPNGGVRDAAIQPLVEAIRQTDPQSAFSWGLSVNDATKRAAVMEATIRDWSSSDAAAVRTALQNASLDPGEKQNYEKLLK